MDQPSLFETVTLIQAEFDELGKAASEFSQNSGLTCEEFCGACCEKPRGVWAREHEMLPLARMLWEDGRAEAILRRWEDKNYPKDVCFMYQPNPLGEGRGRCSAYGGRPLSCRLFGSSFRRGAHGEVELLLCSKQKKIHAASRRAEAANAIDRGVLAAPNTQDWSQRIYRLSQDGSSAHEKELMINEALWRALARLAWYYEPYRERNSSETDLSP